MINDEKMNEKHLCMANYRAGAENLTPKSQHRLNLPEFPNLESEPLKFSARGHFCCPSWKINPFNLIGHSG